MYDGIPEDQIPEDMPEELKELLRGNITPELRAAFGIPEGTELGDVQVIGGGDAGDLLRLAMSLASADEVIAALVAQVGAFALHHTLHNECECGPEGHYDQAFEALNSTIESAKETLRPKYLKDFDQAQFAMEAQHGLEDIEVLSEE